jgi:hypothetical protein
MKIVDILSFKNTHITHQTLRSFCAKGLGLWLHSRGFQASRQSHYSPTTSLQGSFAQERLQVLAQKSRMPNLVLT